jgi:hypothetical protein
VIPSPAIGPSTATLSAGLAVVLLAACGGSGEETGGDTGWLPAGKGDESGITLAYKTWDVLFTNPLCREYSYEQEMLAADGHTVLATKPRNVYCTSADAPASAARPSSPQYRLLEWLRPLGQGDEVFLAFLSFSNADVGSELCAAAERGARITFVLDSRSTQSDRVEACGATVLLRGHAGSIGFAHNKLILINPRAAGPGDVDDHARLVFASGNLSSGTVTHHENWHFLEVSRQSYFFQAHLCLMEAQLDETATSGRSQYRSAINACRAAIATPEEDDVKAFFIPVRDDAQRATRYLLGAVDEAASVDLGAHRFGHTGLIDTLESRLGDDDGFRLNMVADDDLYWLDPEVGAAAKVGLNDWFERDNVRRLEAAGGDQFEIRYLETNHRGNLLHHNKYLIYRNPDAEVFGLLAGAANLTGTGFNDNFENIYFIKVPEVMAQFDRQFARVWDGERGDDEQDPPKATPRGLMPSLELPGI